MWAAGFSINILTLLALVIATGLVVDDAIIVVENITRHRALGAGARAAAVIGTREIVFAVLGDNGTLVAVFVPISFMPGIVGSLFSEFGFVLAFSVTISSLVALTVCPMLAAKLGTGDHPPKGQEGSGPLARLADVLAALYAGILNICLRARYLVVAHVSASPRSARAHSSCCRRKSRPPRTAASSRSASPPSRVATSTTCRKKPRRSRTSSLPTSNRASHRYPDHGRWRSGNRASIVAALAPWSERKRSQQAIQAELQKKLAISPALPFLCSQPTVSASAAAARACASPSPGRTTPSSPTLR